MPLVPASRVLKSGMFWRLTAGSLQVPGDPGVKVACVKSARKILVVNSSEARAIPVAQSIAAESNS